MVGSAVSQWGRSLAGPTNLGTMRSVESPWFCSCIQSTSILVYLSLSKLEDVQDAQNVQDVDTWQVPGAAVTTGPGAAVVTGAAGVVATVSEKESMDFYCTFRVGQFQFWASASLGLLNFFVQLQVAPLYLEQGRRRRSIPRRRLQ